MQGRDRPAPEPPATDPEAVYALGHSNRAFDDFVRLLEAYGIEVVADVRTVPRSRAVPWSSRETLAPALAVAGVGYVHVPELGGLRKPRADSANDAWRNASFRGYADHMQTEEFERGLARLLALAEGARVAVMCAEAVPWRCHRSLVADALVARGVPVVQVLGVADARPHRLTPFARVEDGRVTYPATSRQSALETGGA